MSYRFPKNEDLRLGWLKIIDPSATKYTISASSRLCSRHFLESDFYETGGKRKLYKNAVPSCNLGEAAELPPADFPEDSHCIFLDESMTVPPEHFLAPRTLHSPEMDDRYEPPSPSGAKRVKTVRYAGDLKDDEIPYVSPEEAQEVLPKVYRQLQRTKLRLNLYKRQNVRLRKKVENLKDIIKELRDENDGVKPKRSGQLVSEVKVEPTRLSES